jgi:putative tricarboxylic transport membrane protein
MEPVLQGLSLVLSFDNILLIFGGVLIGVLVGALPGLSSPMAVALLLPFSLSLEPVPAICMMAALYCAGTFGGSITAILINAPGAPPAVATAFDGYPMAKRGEAGRALGLATFSSVFGGVFSLVVFLFAAPFLAKVALKFRPPEYYQRQILLAQPDFRRFRCVDRHHRHSSDNRGRAFHLRHS